MEMNNMGKRSKKIRKQNKNAKKQLKVKPMTKTTHYNGWVDKSNCHTGHNLIFKTVDGIEVWAGGKNRAGGWHLMNPLPQLAMGPSETLGSYTVGSKTKVPEGWSCEQHLDNSTPPLMLSFDWPDFSIPKVNKYFWYAVIDDIREFGIKSISTQCAGGHGRTGVQLAILAYLLGTDDERAAWPDAGVLIDWVREQHCTHAVEATSQQEYIADVCDIPVGENKVHTPSYSGYSWGGASGKVTQATGTDSSFTKGTGKFSGLFIDYQGADWCPHCEHIPVKGFIVNGKTCPKCGEDPQKPKEDFKKATKAYDKTILLPVNDDIWDSPCACCGGTSVVEDECLDCGYDDTPLWDDDIPCSHCGDEYDTTQMMNDVCYPCLFHEKSLPKSELSVKEVGDTVTMKVKCVVTKTMQPSEFIKRFDEKANGFVSYKGDMKKEVKQ